MIESFRHKGLKRFYEEDDRSKTPADMSDRIAIILSLLDAASHVEDLNQPSLRLHALKGDLKGFFSVTVRANCRIIFQFRDGNAINVDFLDYH